MGKERKKLKVTACLRHVSFSEGVAARRSPTRVNKKPAPELETPSRNTFCIRNFNKRWRYFARQAHPRLLLFFFFSFSVPTSSRSYARATLPLLPTLVDDHPKAINQHDCVISCGGFFCGGKADDNDIILRWKNYDNAGQNERLGSTLACWNYFLDFRLIWNIFCFHVLSLFETLMQARLSFNFENIVHCKSIVHTD